MPLSIASSTDGSKFTNSTIFQDSSGVPCVIRWKGDTLICAFQWFRQPVGSVSWDRVAIKYSYDNGKNWTEPSPIIVMDMPGTYQRPFDPTLAVFAKDSIRIYFSSTNKAVMGGLDSLVNTYSAKSADGLNFTFEPNPRVDVADKAVIDPAVVYFKSGWHYTAPVGAPQEGAHHYVSPDGLHFSAVPVIPSDNIHNWTGNLMVNNDSEIRFYGSGSNIWFNSTANGGLWKGFINTNIKGGYPSVIQLDNGNYLMIYVGKPNVNATVNEQDFSSTIIYPNPADKMIQLKTSLNIYSSYEIRTLNGSLIKKGFLDNINEIEIEELLNGYYI